MLRDSVILLFAGLGWALPLQGDEATVSFHRDVLPVFQEHCQGCHQPARALGGYIITTADGRKAAGDSGEPAIVPGAPDDSYLFTQIVPQDGVAEMPKNGSPLTEAQRTLIRQWIAAGAVDDSPSQPPAYDLDHPPTYRRPPQITSLDHSPDGTLLAVAGFHEVLLHDALHPADGEPLARLIGLSERIESVRFSPDGTWLAVTGGSPGQAGEVQVWHVADRELHLSLPVTFDTVYGASWSPDGTKLAFGCADNTVRVVEVATGTQVLFQSAHNDWVLDTVFSADGSHMASVSRDATAKLIEVETERFVDNITSITPGALRGGINAVARHPVRDEILFGGADGMPKIYRMHRQTKRVIGDDANLLWELPPLPGRIFGVDYSRDGRVIAAGSSLDGHGAIHVYGIDPASELPEPIRDILFRPTHQRNAEQRSTLQQHFEAGIETRATISIDTGGIYAVSISPDATQVAAGGADGRVRFIDVGTGNVVHDFAVAPLATPTNPPPAAVQQPSGQPLAARQPQPMASLASTPIKLVAFPPTVELHGPTDGVQLVVMAQLEDGQTVDVTRDVQWSSSAAVHVTPFGSVVPRAPGKTTLEASIGEKRLAIPVTVSGTDAELHPDYIRDVAPIFARAGCNAGTCHGAQDGKNGFKLSLRGYDPLFDVRALTDDLGSRRTNLASPADSLFLLKPTGAVPHEGGVLLRENSDHYQTLLAWVRDGAALDLNSTRVTRIEVQPLNPSIADVGSQIQMRVVASYEDGSQRDVTRDAFIESGNTEIAALTQDHPGLLTVLRRGEAPVLVRYEGAYAATTLTVIGDRAGFAPDTPPVQNPIDELVHAKLARTRTSVAPLCDDYTFVRRLYLDVTGLPPTPAQIDQFVSDPRDSRWKRDALIDQLVGSPEYVEHWTNKWADLLQVNGKFLGREGATRFRDWIRGHVEANTPYDEFARLILTANGSNKDNPAASYYKILREPEITMENTTQLFLATRFNCNKCHDHPFERWTQDQYYELSAYFARVDLKPDPQSEEAKIGGTAVEGARPLYEIISEGSTGEVTHQRTGEAVPPRFPFACDHEYDESATRREQLASWMVSQHNPYFAMSYTNRIWAYLTGRGLIEPIDDIRAGNPPTNPELLTWLTDQFVDSGFDTQQLVRLICKSRTYQHALATDAFNADDELNYSHARARRLPAEVLFDAIYRTVGASSSFPDLPANVRAAALPDVGIKLPDGFLNNLGRPPRESACECERSTDLQMGPVMALINGATVGEALSQPGNAIEQLVSDESDNRRLVQKLFLRVLNRPARAAEIDDALKLIDTIQPQQESLTAELAQYEIDLQPLLVEREAARVAALATKRQQLAEHVAAHADQRQRLQDERAERLEQATAARREVREQLLPQMGQWLEDQQATSWEPLVPQSITSQIGEQFQLEADGSVFVTGPQGKVGANVFEAETNLDHITAVRVEAIADERLPAHGPGRAPNGNFVLSELRLSLGPQRSPRELIQQWDFANDRNHWRAGEGTQLQTEDGKLLVSNDATQPLRLESAFSVDASPLQLEVTAKLTQPTMIHLLWLTDGSTTEDRTGRAVQVSAAGAAQWQTIRVPFDPQHKITQLALEFEAAGAAIELDSVRLVKTPAVEYQAVPLIHAQADYSQPDYLIAQAIDGRPGDNRGWAINPQQGRSHVATFEVAERVPVTGDGLVKIELVHRYNSKDHSLGRYRLAVTRSEGPISPGLTPELRAIVDTPLASRTEEQQAELINHFLRANEQYRAADAALTEAERPAPPDPQEEQLKARVAELEQPLAPDAKLVRLQRAVKLGAEQLATKRVTAAQDIAWALINSPEFLYNH